MGTIFWISVILGTLHSCVAQGTSMLKCIECEHIRWNQTYTFTGVQNIYNLLLSKYNPACGMDNPRDQGMYQQTLQNTQTQNQPNLLPGQTGNQFFQNRYDVKETICPVYADTNRCNYIFGMARVRFLNYQNAEMNLEMHVRNCINAVSEFPDGCYPRNTQHSDVKNFLENRLQFLGAVQLQTFKGEQCYCRTDMCAIVSSSNNIVPSSLSLIFALIVTIAIKLIRH